MELGGKTVLLTGASGGIGQAIARRLHGEGAQLVLSGRRTDVLEPLAAELGARALAADLAQPGEAERLAGECAAVDVLVANAALPGSGRLDGYSVEQIDRVLDVNLRAPIVLTRLLVPGMVERGAGHIVLVSSLAAKSAVIGQSLYAATKFGLRGFGLNLRADLCGTGVGVSTVFPGFIRDAGMFHESGVQMPGYVRTRSPEDVAKAVERAIVRNVAEIDVAPFSVRAGASLSVRAPDLSNRLNRRLGGERVAADFERGQAAKR
jgi:uncharacterized protein